MDTVLKRLQMLVPNIAYCAGDAYYWSPKQQTIIYRADDKTPGSEWALLHETAHALLNHRDYHSDLELLMMEVAAWKKAKAIARDLNIAIDEEHVQDCLDSYRDWLHQRSTCPRCSVVSLQISAQEYRCHNCRASWQVSTSRFCRPYRLSKNVGQSKSRSEAIPEATFLQDLD